MRENILKPLVAVIILFSALFNKSSVITTASANEFNDKILRGIEIDGILPLIRVSSYFYKLPHYLSVEIKDISRLAAENLALALSPVEDIGKEHGGDRFRFGEFRFLDCGHDGNSQFADNNTNHHINWHTEYKDSYHYITLTNVSLLPNLNDFHNMNIFSKNGSCTYGQWMIWPSGYLFYWGIQNGNDTFDATNSTSFNEPNKQANHSDTDMVRLNLRMAFSPIIDTRLPARWPIYEDINLNEIHLRKKGVKEGEEL